DIFPWTVTSIAVAGAPFQLTLIPANSIGPGQDRTYGISFVPSARGIANGLLSVRLASGGKTFSADFSLTGLGVEANLVSSYVLAADGNQILLADNGSIRFPTTPVGQSN